MWINVREMRMLVDGIKRGNLSEGYLEALSDDIARAEKREKERLEKKRVEQIAFLDMVYHELTNAPTPLCPTDIQFLIYSKSQVPVSCAKIAHGLVKMWMMSRPYLAEDSCIAYPLTPEDFHTRYPSVASKNKGSRCYYYIEKN